MIVYDEAMHVFRTPGGHACPMHYRKETSDWNTLTSTLTEDEYGLPSDLTGTAVDVGGYLGSVGIALALDNPGLRVIIVEPVPQNCVLITRNILQNRVEDRVTLHQGAVGRRQRNVTVAYGYRGTVSADHHSFVGNSGILADIVDHETITYPATTLRDLVDMAGGRISFLKTDTEGAEWDLLTQPAVRNVDIISGEWHQYRGHTRGDLAKRLKGTHTVTFSGPEEGPGGFRAVRS